MITRDPVRPATIACVVGAALVLASAPLISTGIAVGVAAGLLGGAINLALTRRTLESGVAFAGISVVRLLTVTAAAIGIGVLLEAPWAPALGLALAQVMLMASATLASARR